MSIASFVDIGASPVVVSQPTDWTIADVLAKFEGYPAQRIHAYPSPGTATEQDLLEAEARTGKICELIDGTLVEKVMASYESQLAAVLIYFFHRYLEIHNIGAVFAPDGYLKILPNQVRAPDVSFVRWERFPGGRRPRAAIYAVSPNLAVEILSPGNTSAEMNRKLHDYFMAGVELVWYIDPEMRSARAFKGENDWSDIPAEGSLSGGDILPDFSLPLAELFARAGGPVAE